jgi:hypothetical protein
VVLVSEQTRASSRAILSGEHVIIKQVPMVQGVTNSPCEQWFVGISFLIRYSLHRCYPVLTTNVNRFMKINLWNLLEYKRIIYLDPDTVGSRDSIRHDTTHDNDNDMFP